MMRPKHICQSCSMPLDNSEDRGTEKDGTKSNVYCKYCYQHGEFTEPELTAAEMKENIILQMKDQNIPAETIEQTVNNVLQLKRWKTGQKAV
jgi:hypothetical protein